MYPQRQQRSLSRAGPETQGSSKPVISAAETVFEHSLSPIPLGFVLI